mgnify:CR=1 FL=1
MILELLCSAAISQISSGTEIVYKDLGRLTPFGRTVDVYIKNPHGDVPTSLGSNGPGTSVAWWIDGEIWKNHDDSQMDFLLNDPANVEWLYNNIPNFSDYQPGDWWACMQDNPNQTLSVCESAVRLLVGRLMDRDERTVATEWQQRKHVYGSA